MVEPIDSDVLVEVSAQTSMNSTAEVRDPDCKGEFKNCETCVYTIARMKRGINRILPAICAELNEKYPKCYKACHEVLSAIQLNGAHIKRWIQAGCFKYEVYGEKELIQPCPTHVICGAIKDLTNTNFCETIPMEDPFK
eukprot:CAMPEP_0167752208 /NCGR_PEP_ID=MMETSP0110_2-20121227/7006_1 /TAXON_ID=629695 /ORGANISM="Gymnochlora sp., Strain CCMP2014" /LENGTH=138 /DNA_ID=CAMNT_0007637789 /DNA_START=347 /DNA_END=763 /DNA_ORIENTATION=+